MSQPLPRETPASWLGGREAESKLRFVERLFGLSEEAACCQCALDWLTEAAGLQRGVCAVVDLEGARLHGAAGLGVSASAVERFGVDLKDEGSLLALALQGGETVSLNPGRVARAHLPSTPLGRIPFHAVPLRRAGDPAGPAQGLMLLAGWRGKLPAVVLWVADLLAERLQSLRYLELQTESVHLKQQREWLQSIVHAVIDPILFTDANGRMVVANASAERLFSAGEEASEGRRRAVALNNMLLSAALFITSGPPPAGTRRELPLVDPAEGQDLLFELLATPITVRPGETGMVSVLRDVTDLRRASEEIEQNYRRLLAAESEARAERDRLDLLIDSVAEPVLVTEPTGDIMLMNPPAERLFTADAGETGDDAERRVAANDAVFTSFLANLSGDLTARWRGELNLLDPHSGGAVPVEAVSGRVFSRAGEETAIVTILHDLTEAMEKARLYEEVKHLSEDLKEKVLAATSELAAQNELLRRQALDLEQASALKSQFLANISHELRTPLNALIGYTHMLLEGVSGDLAPSQREKVRRVDSNARHLLSIINDLLDIARIESGKVRVNVEAFDLRELIDEVMAEMEPLVEGSGLTVETSVGLDLPRIRSDRQKVKQIVLNLLSNALKFTERGSVSIRAFLEPRIKGVAIEVADTGPGIPPESRQRIFEAFEKASGPTKGRSTGTGLGLSICRRLSLLLGAEIRLASEVGKGSTFILALPLRAPRR